MKKILLTLACMFGMGIKASALTSSAVLLQHNGNITTYAAKDIAKAMEDAADGDEVFLNEGTYPGFTISSAIKIKGVGQTTVISGDIVIENTDKDLGDIFIGFLNLEGSLTGKSTMDKLDLLQLKIIKGFTQSGGTVNEVFVDRCDFNSRDYYVNLENNYKETVTIEDVTTTTINPRVKKFTAMNSKFYIRQRANTYPAYPPYTLVNCYVFFTDVYVYGLTFINSTIKNNGGLYDSELINCVYGQTLPTGYNNKLTGCYLDGSVDDLWSINELEGNGYFGNDGTIIGPLGGNTPFTLVPTVPHVTEASLKVDPKKQELNATLTVSPN